MRNYAKFIAGASAVAAVTGLSVVPALAASPHTALGIHGGTQSVIYGVEAPTHKWTASGGTAPYTWSVTETSPGTTAGIPNGVWSKTSGSTSNTFQTGGTWEELTGINPVPGTYTYSVTVTDSLGASKSATVNVAASAPSASLVGVGSNTTQNIVNQVSNDWNATNPSGSDLPLYSFDATDPVTNVAGGNIVTKPGCLGANPPGTGIPRPNGSGAGISALTTENGTSTGGTPCMDFARSSRTRKSTDSTSVSFLAFAGDAISYSTVSGSYAPSNLTVAQLQSIYQCTTTNWNQIPGDHNNQPIVPVIPQSGSGTQATWLAAMGVTTPGPCIVNGVDPANTATPGAPIEENEGINAIFNDVAPFSATNPNPKGELYPFSIGAWTTQKYRDSGCVSPTTCTPGSGTQTINGGTFNYNDVTCFPNATGKNAYGCNENGVLTVKDVNGVSPFNPSSTKFTNPLFPAQLDRILYNVAGNTPAGTQPASPAMEDMFGPTGYMCTNGTAGTDIKNYGWISLPNGTAAGDCGSAL